MAGVAPGQFPGAEIEQAGEHGDELHLAVVLGERTPRFAQDAAWITAALLGDTLDHRFGERHEQRSRQALAGTVADGEEHAVGSDGKEVVESPPTLRAGRMRAAMSMRGSWAKLPGALGSIAIWMRRALRVHLRGATARRGSRRVRGAGPHVGCAPG